MTDQRRELRVRRARRFGHFLAAALAMSGAGGMARGEATARADAPACSPACAAGQVCLQGSCWIQAPSAGPPAPSGSPPPSRDLPPGPYPPAGPYPPTNSYPPPPPGSYPPPPSAPYGYPPSSTYPPAPAYPPGSAYPPGAAYPAYPAYPGYPTTPAPAPLPPRRRNRIFQLMPYAGVHSYHGAGTANVRPGLHGGGLVGFRFQEVFSLNGELTLDSVDLSDLPAGDKLSEVDVSATISPLFSIIDGKLELAFGPKLGFWLGSYDQTSLARGDGRGSFFGWDLGANVALMGQVGRRLWLGGLTSFDLRTFTSSCFTASGGEEGCTKTDLPPADKVLALSLLLMFSI